MTAGVPIPPDALVALVLDSVDAAITVYDGRGRLIRANRCAEQLSGYTEAELRDPETWRRVIPPEDYPTVSAFLERPKLANFPRPNVNYWVTRSGERRLMKWSNVALDDGNGGVLLIVCIGFDITAQRQFERDLIEARNRAQEANAAKSLFLANMSHELRTPLNAIIGFSQIIRDRLVDISPEKSTEYAGDIHDSAVLLLELISDILDMSKLEANKAVVEARNVDVVRLIAGCIRLVRQRAQEVGIKIVQRIDTDLPALYADERMIKQVLLNLLSNAIKFTPSAGAVLVTARRAEGGMEISVADSGIGIPESELLNLFRPFYQVQSPRVQKPHGTGLGLAISKRLMELHEGQIAIASVEGKGTTVTITLPAARCVEEPATATIPQPAAEPMALTGTGA
ncbi:MAG TPA: ATP-binding protein [Dongiaceae bacterium]|nr:ATP-binding protein [Dongiaceae bacterium]